MCRITFTLLTLLTAGIAVPPCCAEPVWPARVHGYHVTAEGARKDAVKAAVPLLTNYARRLDPPLEEWQPTDEFVEKYLLIGEGVARPFEKIGDTQTYEWTFDLKTPNVEQLTRLNRQALGSRLRATRQSASQDRTLLAGSVFGGLLTLLGLTMAYAQWRRTS